MTEDVCDFMGLNLRFGIPRSPNLHLMSAHMSGRMIKAVSLVSCRSSS